MTPSWPAGFVISSVLSMVMRTLGPAAATEFGSPSIASEPPAFGALASVMSMKPIVPPGASE
jgi:hypothetical protein